MGFIYRILNTVNNHAYIGQTCQNDPNKRWKEHVRSIKYGNGCPVLSSAMIKYGIEKFTFEVLLTCSDDEICKYEKEYIKQYNTMVPNGYNVTGGGQGKKMIKTKEVK